MRVLIVAENASRRMGGEAILPLHYFQRLPAQGVETFLLTHERCRGELRETYPADGDRIFYISETSAQTALVRFGKRLPQRVTDRLVLTTVQLSTALRQRKEARRLIAEMRIDLVLQPSPVSPRQPSLLYDLGAPVIIGPMNGGMEFPPAFRGMASPMERAAVVTTRWAAEALNRVAPGKRKAAMLLVANERTRDALPSVGRVRVETMVENGVDLSLWSPPASAEELARARDICHLAMLRDLKGTDMLIEAHARCDGSRVGDLHIIGDGEELERLRGLARALGTAERVKFHGFVSQPTAAAIMRRCRVFALPSLCECGGAAVLEAMALGLPVVVVDWGGPAEYVTDECGVRIAPVDRAGVVSAVAEAIRDLSADDAKAVSMGGAGRRRIEELFSWDRKAEEFAVMVRDVARSAMSARASVDGGAGAHGVVHGRG